MSTPTEKKLRCPACGSSPIERTLMLMPPDGPDMNRASCVNCGWNGYLEACKKASQERRKLLDEFILELETNTVSEHELPGIEKAVQLAQQLKEK